jgi:hypothetical protein
VLDPDVEKGAVDAITRSYRLGPPGYLVAIVDAVIDRYRAWPPSSD